MSKSNVFWWLILGGWMAASTWWHVCKIKFQVSLARCQHPDLSVAVAILGDDLKKIEGIGPQIEKLLQQAHIWTYQELSLTSVEAIQHILDAAGPGFQMHDPAT